MLRTISILLTLFGLGLGIAENVEVVIPEDSVLLTELNASLAFRHPEEILSTTRRMGDKTLEIKALFSAYATLDEATALLCDFGNYSNWALTHINDRLDGSQFMLLFHNIRLIPPTLGLLDVEFSIDLPFFRKQRFQSIAMRNVPGRIGPAITARTTDGEADAISRIRAFLRAFPHEDRVWVYTKSEIQLSSRILYEAFPEKIVMRETGERIRRILDSFYNETSRRRSLASGDRE